MIRGSLLAVLATLLPLVAAHGDPVPGPMPGIAVGGILRGGFAQERHLAGFAQPLRSTGRFVLVPGRGIVWRVEAPFATTTVITAAGMVQRVEGVETMRLSSARLPFLSQLYAMLGGALAGDWRALEAGFSVERRPEGTHWQVRLTPRDTRDPAMPFAAIVAQGGRFLDSVTMTRLDGDFDDLTFGDQTLDAAPLAAGEADLLRAAQP